MDKPPTKHLKALVRDHQRIPLQGCDKSRRITKAWLADRGHDVETMFGWL